MVQRAKRDSSSAAGGPAWVQPGWLPPEHVHITLQVLSDGPGHVVRYQVEITNPVTKELLALRARPFHNDCDVRSGLTLALEWLQDALDQLGVGDPF